MLTHTGALAKKPALVFHCSSKPSAEWKKTQGSAHGSGTDDTSGPKAPQPLPRAEVLLTPSLGQAGTDCQCGVQRRQLLLFGLSSVVYVDQKQFSILQGRRRNVPTIAGGTKYDNQVACWSGGPIWTKHFIEYASKHVAEPLNASSAIQAVSSRHRRK